MYLRSSQAYLKELIKASKKPIFPVLFITPFFQRDNTFKLSDCLRTVTLGAYIMN
jgi:hypothetical protein